MNTTPLLIDWKRGQRLSASASPSGFYHCIAADAADWWQSAMRRSKGHA
jgi:hypothetical protein